MSVIGVINVCTLHTKVTKCRSLFKTSRIKIVGDSDLMFSSIRIKNKTKRILVDAVKKSMHIRANYDQKMCTNEKLRF